MFSLRQFLHIGAGLTALLSLALLYFFYGQAIAGSLHLSLPTLSLNTSGLSSSGQLTDYQENPTLSIPKLGIQTPIIRDVSVDDQSAYDAALREGVAQAKGSADLEANNGNSFLFGHSSNLTLHPTSFDTIFAGLPRLVPNDTISVAVAGRVTNYTVQTSQAIDANAVQYLSTNGERRLTLVTCWPLGTDYKRWVVEATRVN